MFPRRLFQQALLLLFLGFLVTISVCREAHSAEGRFSASKVDQARGKQGMVASVTTESSRVGYDTLRAGGNAVDAAIAMEFALAVTWPEAGNIGGGGFMLIMPGDGKPPVCIDYRETAPLAATATMFDKNSSRHTCKMVGVPGTVRGMQLAHKNYGKLPWKQLVAPAVKLAKNGFEVDKELAKSINKVLAERATGEAQFRELKRVYGHPQGRPWQAGDRLVLPDLADTLGRIAENGAEEFYRGKTAQLVAQEMKQCDGLITLRDLQLYEAKVREPIHGTFRGFDVYGPPPPSSGGICLVEMLNILENFDLAKYPRYSARNLHLIAEAARRAFCDRARHLGDADFVTIPDHLTKKSYAKKLAAGIDLEAATQSTSLAPDIPVQGESDSTTHFSVVDSSGMAVSNTTTLEQSWGARIVVRGAGFVLNNEMGDFNRLPGVTTRSGHIGTKANLIVPRKRMLSSQTPTIIAKGGKPYLVVGSPGGRTIINTVLNIVLSVCEFNQPLDQAIAAPRTHHQWLPDLLQFEGANLPEYQQAVATLKKMGHVVQPRSGGGGQGSSHSILRDPTTGEFHGVSDWRRGGKAYGY